MQRSKICLTFMLAAALLGAWGSTALAGAPSRLRDVVHQEGMRKTRITLEFDHLPKYRVDNKGQRVDLILRKARIADELPRPAEGSVVRTLYARMNDRCVVSFVLRRPPQRVETSTFKKDDLLYLDLYWTKRSRWSRPALAYELRGNLHVGQNGTIVRRTVRCKYNRQWKRFFQEYEGPLRLAPPLRYSLPRFPCTGWSAADYNASERVYSLARDGEWGEALQLMKGPDGEREAQTASRRTLLRSELLIRAGRDGKASSILAKALAGPSAPSPLGQWFRYLALLAGTGERSQYRIYDRVLQADPNLPSSGRLGEYASMLKAEAALGAKYPRKALAVLSDMDPSSRVRQLYRMRKGQALKAAGRSKQALAVFDRMDRKRLAGHPRALADYARLLYEKRRYGESEPLFARLSKAAASERITSLALYMEAMSVLHQGETEEAGKLLGKIRKKHPGTEGSRRARMKLTDLLVADESHQDMLALASEYDAIVSAATNRHVREEAIFKTLLTFHLDDLTYRCVKKLGGFLRDFAYGRLRQEAEALLVEILPEVLRSLLDKRLFIEATSIVAEHRDILAQTRFPQDILHRMAESFQSIGLHGRATKIYEYMLSTAATDSERRSVFPALIESYYRQHNFRAVREFAEYFLQEFPESRAKARVYLLRARSFFAEGKLKQAEQLLIDRSRPVSRDLEVLTARVLRAQGKHALVERYLSRVDVTRGKSRGRLILERADSLVRCGCRKQALELFERLQEISDYRERATYRMGQILFDLGKEERALKILRPLADNNSGSLWSRMARETMAVRQF